MIKKAYILKTTAFSGPIMATLLFGLILSSSYVSADDIVDEINITVPMSCTMSGAGMDTHNANINNGTYTPNIGTTTMHVFCNDNEGFSIYAAGYTGDTIGETNSNKLVGTSASGNAVIESGLATSAGNPDVSNWAMKLAITQDSGDTTGTNAFIIDSAPNVALPSQAESGATVASFSQYHVVPNEYVKVAHKTSATDMIANTGGAKITSTYAAYISKTQAADTYTGQVKYTLVHPHTAPEPVGDNQIGVIYDGNGLFFDQAGIKSTNRVVYENVCEDEYGYIADTPAILHTDNLDQEGNQNGSYYRNYEVWLQGDDNYFEGATKTKVEIYYKINYDTSININANEFSEWFSCLDEGCEGTLSYIINNNSASIFYDAYGESTPGYDYGIIARLYPVYDEPTVGTTYGLVQESVCAYRPVVGTFINVIGGNDYWYNTELSEDVETFYADGEYDYDKYVIDYLSEHAETLFGTTITLHASNKYTVIFDANGGSGTMASQEVYQYDDTSINESTFTMPHKEVIKWTTNPDGSGKTLYASPDSMSGDVARTLQANAGETIRLYAQWGDCMRGYICYDDNDANSLTTMNRQKYPSYYSGRQLWASNYQFNNHGFAGWNTKADGTGVSYGPNQDIVLQDDDIQSEGIRLYAMWINSAGNLQNWAGCSTMNIGDVTALTDTRDSNTYAVAKLADGNCWMIENMRLGGSLSITLTTFDTQSAGTLPASISSFGTSLTGQYLNANNTISTVSRMANNFSNIYSYGNYYSWPAAVNSTDEISSGTVNTSICPSGWHLPYGYTETVAGGGNTSGGFYYLGVQLGSSLNNSVKWRQYPNNFLLSGHYSSASASDRGSSGSYQTATAYYLNSNDCSYRLIISLTNTSYGNRSYVAPRFTGDSIRCVMNASN